MPTSTLTDSATGNFGPSLFMESESKEPQLGDALCCRLNAVMKGRRLTQWCAAAKIRMSVLSLAALPTQRPIQWHSDGERFPYGISKNARPLQKPVFSNLLSW